MVDTTKPISIIVPDHMVIVDGEAQKVDLSSLGLAGVHAVQWDGTKGDVEYNYHSLAKGPASVAIREMTQFQMMLDAWEVAGLEHKEQVEKQAIEDARREAEREQEARRANPGRVFDQWMEERPGIACFVAVFAEALGKAPNELIAKARSKFGEF